MATHFGFGFNHGRRSSILELELATQATGAVNTLNVPNDIQAGDLMVLMAAANKSGSTGDVTFPSGFTGLTSLEFNWGSPNVFFIGFSYRLALGNEGGGTITGMTSANNVWEKGLFVFRPNVPLLSAVPGGWGLTSIGGGNNNNTTQLARQIEASGQPDQLLAMSFYWNISRARSSPTETVMSPTDDDELVWGVASNAVTKWKFYPNNSPPANIDCSTVGWNGQKVLANGYFKLTEIT
jgi:hypothetical protein